MNQLHPHDLAPLFAKARNEGLWFYCRYQQIWFTPDELQAQQAAGRFHWSAENWLLRSPEEYLEQFKDAADTATKAFVTASAKVSTWRRTA